MSEQTQPENPGESGQAGRAQETTAMVPSQTEASVKVLSGGSRAMTAVALAVSLVSGATALYVWKEFEHSRTGEAVARYELSHRVGELEKTGGQISSDATQARQESEKATRQSQATQAALDELRTRITRDRGEWLLAEADYLLSIANRKLRFEHDVNGAITALEEADARLMVINDSSLIPVRSAVARDLQALRRVTPVDRTGIAVQLSALIQASSDLPFAQGIAGSRVQSAGDERPKVQDLRGFLGAVWSDIKGLITIRRIDQAVVPLLPPEQRDFLRQNLALKLDTARLALLQREPAVYQKSLEEAQAWLSRYFDTEAVAVRSSLESVGRLRGIAIAPAVPDLNDALRILRRIKRDLDLEARGGGER